MKEKAFNWIKKNKTKIFILLAVLIVLAVAFFAGNSSTEKKDNYLNSTAGEINSPNQTESGSDIETATDIGKVDSNSSNSSNSRGDGQIAEDNIEKNSEAGSDNSIDNSSNDGSNNSSDNNKQENSDFENYLQETASYSNNENTASDNTIVNNDRISANTNSTTEKSIESTTKAEINKTTETTAAKTEKKGTCTISISCNTVLNNMSSLKENKKSIIPADGWILKETNVEFNEGATVFDVLQSICKDKKIHMEHSYSPVYKSSYVEGINNLYEFDCGSTSGWMYSVNGEFLNYGASKVEVKNGDVIKWEFTCDLGNDIR